VGKNLKGDYVECGVNSGILSRAIMEYLDFAKMSDRQFYLLDTFCGIPEDDGPEKRIRQINRVYPDIYEEVVNTFAPFSNAKLVRGRIPETLSEIKSTKICYLSIDLNVAAPELAAGEYLWPRMVSGAVILLDDYGWAGHEEQKIGWDEFARERNVPLLPLPTGQGIIIKP
jgi:O-methyltransferase